MTTEDLDYNINLIDGAVVGFEGTDSNFESSTVGKILSNSNTCYREVTWEKKYPLMQQTSLLSHLKKLPQPFQPSATATLTSQQPATLKQDPPQQRGRDSQMMAGNV